MMGRNLGGNLDNAMGKSGGDSGGAQRARVNRVESGKAIIRDSPRSREMRPREEPARPSPDRAASDSALRGLARPNRVAYSVSSPEGGTTAGSDCESRTWRRSGFRPAHRIVRTARASATIWMTFSRFFGMASRGMTSCAAGWGLDMARPRLGQAFPWRPLPDLPVRGRFQIDRRKAADPRGRSIPPRRDQEAPRPAPAGARPW